MAGGAGSPEAGPAGALAGTPPTPSGMLPSDAGFPGMQVPSSTLSTSEILASGAMGSEAVNKQWDQALAARAQEFVNRGKHMEAQNIMRQLSMPYKEELMWRSGYFTQMMHNQGLKDLEMLKHSLGQEDLAALYAHGDTMPVPVELRPLLGPGVNTWGDVLRLGAGKDSAIDLLTGVMRMKEQFTARASQQDLQRFHYLFDSLNKTNTLIQKYANYMTPDELRISMTNPDGSIDANAYRAALVRGQQEGYIMSDSEAKELESSRDYADQLSDAISALPGMEQFKNLKKPRTTKTTKTEAEIRRQKLEKDAAANAPKNRVTTPPKREGMYEGT